MGTIYAKIRNLTSSLISTVNPIDIFMGDALKIYYIIWFIVEIKMGLATIRYMVHRITINYHRDVKQHITNG